MDAPSSLNILYILEKIYTLFGGTSEDVLQTGFLAFIQNIEWVALGLSIIFLIGFIVLRLLLAEVEHHIHHQRTHKELETAGAQAATPKNPRWQQVLALVNSSHEGDWRRAIIEADSMLAGMLDERGFPGSDVGEKLTGASAAHFATLSAAWEGHRLRNRIAHEGEALHLSQREAMAAIDSYRRVFQEFSYI